MEEKRACKVGCRWRHGQRVLNSHGWGLETNGRAGNRNWSGPQASAPDSMMESMGVIKLAPFNLYSYITRSAWAAISTGYVKELVEG